jgi:hypothetical protein
MTTSPATCWNAGRFIGVIVRGQHTGQTVDETMLPRRRANESRPSCCDIFPTGRVVSVLWGPGAWPGSRWSSARPEARGGRCRQVRGGERNKRKRESCWKSGGGRVRLYTWRRDRAWQMEVGSDAIPDAAGGEGGHGAAKPEGVIHRYSLYLYNSDYKLNAISLTPF